ncbi:unnamed protein product [Brachionus calyciflorus]|uniref:Uncharacterized protein n=1 Tax=Brachionus calyciflorus TaxID=104777 RepID=A0A814GXI4_9BILA|nr:unnamed protein product [Brachionus calyciflorus]
MSLSLHKFSAPDIQDLGQSLQYFRKFLFEKFTKKWSLHSHLDLNKSLNCSKLVDIDGNYKCNRLKCMYSNIFIISEEFSPIRIGCVKTPERGSYFCKDHINFSDLLFFNIDNKSISYNASQIKPSKIDKNRIKKIHDCFYTQDDEMLFLVELDNSNLEWIDESYLNNEEIQRFCDEKHPNNEDLSCQTLKSKAPCIFKTRTKGIAISAFNCGIINGYREFFGHESEQQILLFYLDLVENFQTEIPEFLVYDDGCHLKKCIDKNKLWEKSRRANFIEKIKIAIDRFHFKGHKDKWCKKHLNPDKFDDLERANTVVCEEVNYWLSGYKCLFIRPSSIDHFGMKTNSHFNLIETKLGDLENDGTCYDTTCQFLINQTTDLTFKNYFLKPLNLVISCFTAVTLSIFINIIFGTCITVSILVSTFIYLIGLYIFIYVTLKKLFSEYSETVFGPKYHESKSQSYSNDRNVCFIAKASNGRIIGYSNLFQEQGFERVLGEACIQFAKDNKYKSLSLGVLSSQSNELKVYKELGFKKVREKVLISSLNLKEQLIKEKSCGINFAKPTTINLRRQHKKRLIREINKKGSHRYNFSQTELLQVGTIYLKVRSQQHQQTSSRTSLMRKFLA